MAKWILKWMTVRQIQANVFFRSFSCNSSYFNSNKDNHYEILGISKNASKKEIRIAYLTKSKEYHPDKNLEDLSMHDKFIQVTEAYETLSHSEKRLLYDNAQNLQSRSTNINSTDPFGTYQDPKGYVDYETQNRMYEEFYSKTYPEYKMKLAEDYRKRRSKNKKIVFIISSLALCFGLFNYSRIIKYHDENQKHLESISATNAAFLRDGKTGYRSYLKRTNSAKSIDE